jgi:hypothetical protein
MKLAKSCKQEFNIKNCNTLRVGTFKYYKEMDPEFSIADAKEGSLSIEKFSNENSAHGDTLMKVVTSGLHSEFTLNVRAGATPSAILVDPFIDFKNCFIFCLSTTNDNEQYDPSIVNKENDSYYTVENNNINSFANYVGHLLREQLTYDDIDFGGIGNPSISEFLRGPISVEIVHSEVTYPKIKDAIAENLNGLLPLDVLKYATFNKDERYKSDREYRILFLITHPMYGIIPVKKSPKDLILKKIIDFIT